MRLFSLISIPLLIGAALPVVAETGDAAMVIRYCGAPSSEHQGLSQVTSLMERDLTYGDTILHFEPREDGWSFLSGWRGHTVLTRKMVADRMTCFGEAMAASSATEQNGEVNAMDPTIKAQTAPLETDNSTFGIPHLALILVLVLLVLAVYLFLPRRGRIVYRTQDVEQMRMRRRPDLERFRWHDE